GRTGSCLRLRIFYARLDRRRRCQARGGDLALVRLRASDGLHAARRAVRRRPDAATAAVSQTAFTRPAGAPALDPASARQNRRRTLRHRARRRGVAGLPAYRLDAAQRPLMVANARRAQAATQY